MNASKAKPAPNKLSDLAALHDEKVRIPAKIRVGLKLMTDGGHAWMYEEDLRKLTGLSPVAMRDYREEFKTYWATMPATNGKRDARKVWFATPKLRDEWEKNHG